MKYIPHIVYPLKKKEKSKIFSSQNNNSALYVNTNKYIISVSFMQLHKVF